MRCIGVAAPAGAAAAERGEGRLADGSDFLVRCWGVRGSIACPGPETARYGGNTACVEMRCGGHVLVFDVGTGLRPLGKALMQEGFRAGDVFLTHTHFDHIIGIPFFAPAFDSGVRLRVWAGHLMPHGSNVCDVLRLMMRSPLFPVPVEIFQADIDYRDFGAGEVLVPQAGRSEEHTSELQSLMRISYAVFCLKKKNKLIIST